MKLSISLIMVLWKEMDVFSIYAVDRDEVGSVKE